MVTKEALTLQNKSLVAPFYILLCRGLQKCLKSAFFRKYVNPITKISCFMYISSRSTGIFLYLQFLKQGSQTLKRLNMG